MNKFQKHYGNRPVSELLKILLEHKLETQPLATEWYKGLLAVLEELRLEGSARTLFIRIQDTEHVALGLQAETVLQQIAELRTTEDRDNPLEIDFAKIIDAGKTLKLMARIIAVSLCIAILLAILSFAGDYGTRSSLLGLLVIGGLLVQVIVLSLLFNAGNALQTSVRRARRNPPDKNT